MKKIVLLLVILLPIARLWSQENQGNQPKTEDRNFRIPLIGEKAPSFTAESTLGTINFPEDYGRHWKVLLSHPQDFTPVCSSEILELANLQSEFDKLDARVVIVSTDPLNTHIQWKKALEAINYKGRTPEKIKFPLVEDENLTVAKLYGMIHAPSNTTKDVRGVFIIDPNNVIQTIFFYPNVVGRSTEEIVRTLTALETATKDHVMTPADWKAGNDVFLPYPPVPDDKVSTSPSNDIYKLTWFMIYKK
ncbi:MAG: redoxin domain-containing protein, partial [Bacteroidales bacterium]